MLRMRSGENEYTKAAVPILRELGLPVEELDGDELARRFPQINPEGLSYGVFERNAGYLLARRGCERVLREFQEEGGSFRRAEAAPGGMDGGRMREIRLSDGSTVEADLFVFACGPWLAKLFPEFDPPLVRPHPAGGLLFRPAGGALRPDRGGVPHLDRGPVLRHPRDPRSGASRSPTTGGAPTVRSHGRRPDAVSEGHPGGARVHGAPVPGAPGSAADRGARLPVRGERRREPDRGHPSRSGRTSGSPAGDPATATSSARRSARCWPGRRSASERRNPSSAWRVSAPDGDSRANRGSASSLDPEMGHLPQRGPLCG